MVNDEYNSPKNSEKSAFFQSSSVLKEAVLSQFESPPLLSSCSQTLSKVTKFIQKTSQHRPV